MESHEARKKRGGWRIMEKDENSTVYYEVYDEVGQWSCGECRTVKRRDGDQMTAKVQVIC